MGGKRKQIVGQTLRTNRSNKLKISLHKQLFSVFSVHSHWPWYRTFDHLAICMMAELGQIDHVSIQRTLKIGYIVKIRVNLNFWFIFISKISFFSNFCPPIEF